MMIRNREFLVNIIDYIESDWANFVRFSDDFEYTEEECERALEQLKEEIGLSN